MTEPRWYCITSDGAATLCVDRADAEKTAAEADIRFPRRAPHRAVQLVEAAPQPQQAPAPQRKALTDEQRIDWLCEEAEFTCGQWQVVIDSDKESFLDAVDEMVRAAHGITQPSQQEQ